VDAGVISVLLSLIKIITVCNCVVEFDHAGIQQNAIRVVDLFILWHLVIMSHDNSHTHSHSHAVSISAEGLRAFQIGIGLNVLFVLTEAIAGFTYKSISLLSDAGHNLGDVASLLLSYFAFKLSHRSATHRYTYGFKSEVGKQQACYISQVMTGIAQ
jgi:hypothetical protein